MILQYNKSERLADELNYTNRELSWLEFNKRVLELAHTKNSPLGERLKFSAIFASNLDEFFMVRVGSLFDQTLLKVQPVENKTGLRPAQQLEIIMPKVADLIKYKDRVTSSLLKKLKKSDLYFVNFSELSATEVDFWQEYFLNEIAPLLSPQIIDKRHPFPFLRNLESYAAVTIKTKSAEKYKFGIIPIGQQLPRVVSIRYGARTLFAFTEELILHFVEHSFNGMGVVNKCVFRVTRNADLSMTESMLEHDIDYRLVMSELLKKRRKLAAVRLETSPNAPLEIVNYLLSKLELSQNHVFEQNLPLCMSAYFDLVKQVKSHPNSTAFFYPHRYPKNANSRYRLLDATIGRNVLACYPFHSMRPFINMLYNAAVDPDVVSIKMTLYRLADDSKVIDALTMASEHGKEVVAIVELRARFDEQNNIDLSNRLEDAGCTVLYGFEDYKVHSKLCLITRVRDGKTGYLSTIGTGNFNENTAELYTDISYITQNEEIGADIATLFNDLSLGRNSKKMRHLLVAPNYFKSEIIRQIEVEMSNHRAGLPSRILIKCNSISDKELIDKLYEASGRGIKIDLIVRGICCLKIGLANRSENITVRSIVGRYLEHSRIYSFGVGESERFFIASGDLLTRNTERRIEVGVEIIDQKSKKHLAKLLEFQLLDNCNSWILQPDGSYKKVEVPDGEQFFDSHTLSHEYFFEYDEGYNCEEKPALKTGFSLIKYLKKLFFRT